MSALPEELGQLVSALSPGSRNVEHAHRTYHIGTIGSVGVVLVYARIGKVAAAATATRLIAEFDCRGLIFTGVAGAIDPALHVGDVVVATDLVQHDMDARPLFPRFEIPLLGVSRLPANAELSQALQTAAERYFKTGFHEDVPPSVREEFGIHAPKVATGTIGSGDCFVSRSGEKAELASSIPGLRCVEMEGAAVAQVCFENGVPFAVARTISDTAGEGAAVDFVKFVGHVAPAYAVGIVSGALDAVGG
ncbi:MAG: 5'-methylthioadenosine/adenosylhomocysteine nucleosidase [Acidobacteriota bacterium]|nr:5'-methylthioadenosine/adenosylhomocysteine nucleosidase [Acidobacteriota bacterium]